MRLQVLTVMSTFHMPNYSRQLCIVCLTYYGSFIEELWYKNAIRLLSEDVKML